MSELRQVLLQFIDERIRQMLARPPAWGSEENVELQVLQLLEVRALALHPDIEPQSLFKLLQRAYERFIKDAIDGSDPELLAVILQKRNRLAEFGPLLGRFVASWEYAQRDETPSEEHDLAGVDPTRNTSQVRITVDASPGSPSSYFTAQGARDYDVLLTVTDARSVDRKIQAEATLVPGQDGELSTWGQLDHWLTSAGAALVRELGGSTRQARELCTAIEVACISGEHQEIEVDASDFATATIGARLGKTRAPAAA